LLTPKFDVQPKSFSAGYTNVGIGWPKTDGENRIFPAHCAIEACVQIKIEALHSVTGTWMVQDARSQKAYLLGCQMKCPSANARISVQAIVLLSFSSEIDK
jgi:hypothetical protein